MTKTKKVWAITLAFVLVAILASTAIVLSGETIDSNIAVAQEHTHLECAGTTCAGHNGSTCNVDFETQPKTLATAEPHDHDFENSTVYAHGNDQHWKVCAREDCGVEDTENKVDCSGGRATCMSPAICEVCQNEYGTANADNHALVHHDAQPATCTEIGWDAYDTCSRCDHTTYLEIPALGHDLQNHDAQPATCTEIGWEAYVTCSRCDHTTYVEIPALGHDYSEDWSSNDTHHWHDCSRCDEKGANGEHTFGDDNVCDSCEYALVLHITVIVENGHVGGNSQAVVVENSTVTVVANEPKDGEQFIGWEVNGEIVSDQTSYTFNATDDIHIKAIFGPVESINGGVIAGLVILGAGVLSGLVMMGLLFKKKKDESNNAKSGF